MDSRKEMACLLRSRGENVYLPLLSKLLAEIYLLRLLNASTVPKNHLCRIWTQDTVGRVSAVWCAYQWTITSPSCRKLFISRTGARNKGLGEHSRCLFLGALYRNSRFSQRPLASLRYLAMVRPLNFYRNICAIFYFAGRYSANFLRYAWPRFHFDYIAICAIHSRKKARVPTSAIFIHVAPSFYTSVCPLLDNNWLHSHGVRGRYIDGSIVMRGHWEATRGWRWEGGGGVEDITVESG